jgi:hypothetical protein
MKGPDFAGVDNRLLALELVKKNYTDGTIFGADKEVYQPKDILYKKNILCLRGRFRPVTKVNEDMMRCATEYFKKHNPNAEAPVMLSEITLNTLSGDDFDNKDFLDRADLLCSLGYTVMVLGIILGILNIMELFSEKYYKNAPGELLHYFGEIFTSNTKMLVYPYQPDARKPVITTENLKVPDSLKSVFAHLRENGFMVDLKGYDVNVMQIFSPKVIAMIKAGETGWEELVPETVAEIIKQKCLFEYPCEVPTK